MPVVRCACGARYKVPEGLEGRKARCKKCGGVFRVPAARGEATPSSDNLDLESMARAESEAAPIEVAAPPAQTATGSTFDQSGVSTAFDPDAAPRESHLARVRPRTGFWSDVGWTLLFFTTPNNLIMFVIVWVLYIVAFVAGFAPIVGLFASLFVHMFIIAWYMSIIGETASGEDDLPGFSLSDGYFDSVLVPAVQYAGSWLVLVAPAIAYAILSFAGLDTFFVVHNAIADPYSLITAGDNDPVLMVLVTLALFLWPMTLMCTSMGGLSSLVRLDLIVATIAKTFPAYLFIAVLVSAATILPQIITEAYAASKLTRRPGWARCSGRASWSWRSLSR